jgi:uncharacterized SAM-binding protein YcdF (DUF218 family)
VSPSPTDASQASGGLSRALPALGLAGLVLFLVAAFTPLANRFNVWMAGTAERARADAIVVLGRGGADTDGVLTNRSLRRVLHGIGLYGDALAPRLVVSGSAEEMEARSALARGLGVPAEAILMPDPAHSTREEAAHLGRLLLPRGSRRILLVADPIDMPRARATMAHAGFTVLPAPTAASGPSDPEDRLGLLRDIFLELAGWAYHWLRGTL